MLRRIAEHRCPGCEIRKSFCFCAAIPSLPLRTRVLFIMHTAEEVLTSNTARLAAKALPNSEVRIRGRKSERMATDDFMQTDRTSLLLFPSSHAAELSAEFVARLARPVTLIVPDGSWRGTRRFVRRDPALAGIVHVTLPPGPPSEYRLRAQADSRGLCTLEAVARAVGFLENFEAQARLEDLLRTMVARTLQARGDRAPMSTDDRPAANLRRFRRP